MRVNLAGRGLQAPTFGSIQEEVIGLFMAQYLGSILPLSENLRTAAYQMLD